MLHLNISGYAATMLLLPLSFLIRVSCSQICVITRWTRLFHRI